MSPRGSGQPAPAFPDISGAYEDTTSNVLVSSFPSDSSGLKLRKFDRACDFCRRRKTKCDGPSQLNNVCSNCIQNHNDCTYVEGSRPRGPPKAYVVSLEDRLEKLEAFLKRLRPEEDFYDQLGPPVIRDSWKHASSSGQTEIPGVLSTSSITPADQILRKTNVSPRLNAHRTRSTPEPKLIDAGSGSEHLASSDNEDYAETSLTRGLKHLTLRGLEPVANTGSSPCELGDPGRDNQMRFHGKSSAFHLVGTTREFKKQHQVATGSPGSEDSATNSHSSKREYFWISPSWEKQWEGIHLNDPIIFQSLVESFPPTDLAETLLDLYFYNVNLMYPLLHRPTFEKQWAVGLHLRDASFAALCMCIFAVGSRWCDDERVIGCFKRDIRPSGSRPNWGMAGWGYYSAAMEFFRHRRSILYPTSLCELQIHCLFSTYLHLHFATSAPWFFVSIGLRKAQDLGIHRKKIYNRAPTIEDELWKRAFWVLLGQDRVAAVTLGRSCSTKEEDVDLELPLEVDEEHWGLCSPDTPPKQPSGRPSVATAFNLWIKLSKISAFAIRTIYAVDKSKVIPQGTTAAQWKEQIVKQLNSAMTEWVDSVPDHLRWSTRMDNKVFSNQSATLFLYYYTTQILIYRSFISQPHSEASSQNRYNTPPHELPFPAAAICINAAKACLRILEVQLAVGMTDIPAAIIASQFGAAILVNHVWRLKAQLRAQAAGASVDDQNVAEQSILEAVYDIEKFLEILDRSSIRWPLAGLMLKHLRESLPADLGGTVQDTSDTTTFVRLPDQPRNRHPSARRNGLPPTEGVTSTRNPTHSTSSYCNPPEFPSRTRDQSISSSFLTRQASWPLFADDSRVSRVCRKPTPAEKFDISPLMYDYPIQNTPFDVDQEVLPQVGAWRNPVGRSLSFSCQEDWQPTIKREMDEMTVLHQLRRPSSQSVLQSRAPVEMEDGWYDKSLTYRAVQSNARSAGTGWR